MLDYMAVLKTKRYLKADFLKTPPFLFLESKEDEEKQFRTLKKPPGFNIIVKKKPYIYITRTRAHTQKQGDWST